MLSAAGPQSSYEHDLAVIERLSATPADKAYELEKALQLIYSRAATANLDAYDVRDVAKDAVSIQYRLFDVRMRLRELNQTARAANRLSEADLARYERDLRCPRE